MKNGAESSPKVSVILPVYNAATTLARALESVRIQRFSGLEIVIFDDASVDRSKEVVDRFDDLPIHYIRSVKNVGAAAARNLAIEKSCGEYLAFLDADDEWLPQKLAQQVEILDRNPSVSFVFCEAGLIGAGGVRIGRVNDARDRPTGQDGWKALLRHPCVATPCVVARRSSFIEAGHFDILLLSGEDQDMWIRLALVGPVAHLEQELVRVYDLDNSLSKRERTNSVGAILPRIHKYIDQMREELSDSEVDVIVRQRHLLAGRTYCDAGEFRKGSIEIAKAMRHGSPVVGNLKYLAKNSPPARLLKATTVKPNILMDNQFEAEVDAPPRLIVIVDTEEEFDWGEPFSKTNRSVKSILKQEDSQVIFNRFSVKPTYVVDFPVAETEEATAVLASFLEKGECLVGAHLQPWVNPPYGEEESDSSSFPGNLPFAYEYRKLDALTNRIEHAFGFRPDIYKAGRYGLGGNTPRILASLGYKIDLSVVPYTDFTPMLGADFTGYPAKPFWFGDGYDLYGVPLTREFTGILASAGSRSFPLIGSRWGEKYHLPGVFARSGLLERITLTPEGVSLVEMTKLATNLHRRKWPVFCLTYHSSSLLVGGSPYVSSEVERVRFLDRIEAFLEFFFNELGGVASTPMEIYQSARAKRFG